MSMENAVAAVAVFAEEMAREAVTTSEGATVIAKAQQLLAAGAHSELTFSFAGDIIEASLSIRTDTGDKLSVGTKRMMKRPHGHC